jgi:hypothetical protein
VLKSVDTLSLVLCVRVAVVHTPPFDRPTQVTKLQSVLFWPAGVPDPQNSDLRLSIPQRCGCCPRHSLLDALTSQAFAGSTRTAATRTAAVAARKTLLPLEKIFLVATRVTLSRQPTTRTATVGSAHGLLSATPPFHLTERKGL